MLFNQFKENRTKDDESSVHRLIKGPFCFLSKACICSCHSISLLFQILTVCQSSLNEVKRYAIVMDACPSCKLMLFLMHCSMHKNETERYNYWKNNHSLESEPIIASKLDRKLVLVALLNSWQELLEPHVKVS